MQYWALEVLILVFALLLTCCADESESFIFLCDPLSCELGSLTVSSFYIGFGTVLYPEPSN